ncbi:ABC transporter substrate-binding protein [Rhodococcus sp. (in: high G+C Gram-positive bacteria)]|uniref:ABC transporter substrate-binding protein n=1 Tax=Rhodococcus sp. TaxID=1831 RepID=UPI00257F9FFA|nr:ABC transporter substrate-binding protein [Rhodococcus sp. (in: high G+C Gram-positive bacteria)]MBQ7803112.1 ABC transporter substrate-binding protein [Rhodococcus sp. (in: high G+C Gram-positive bacteria)]
MKIRNRAAAALSAGAAISLLLTSCSGGSSATAGEPEGDPQNGGTVTFAFNTDAQSVDPVTCAIGIGVGPCQAIYGALLYYDLEAREITPGMAESFTSADGKTWTLKLRPELTFTDGTPFNAEAVAFNWQRALDPSMLSPSLTAAKGITWSVVDSTTLTVVANDVNYQLPFLLSEPLAFIGSPTAIQSKGADFANSPVGAGPFTLGSWARGTEMILDRNPGYWDQPRPYVDRFVYKTIPADDQRYNALQSGEVDVISVISEKYVKRAEAAGMGVATTTLLGGNGVRLSSRGVLADPDVRSAIGKLIDNEQIRAAAFPDDPGSTHFFGQENPLYDEAAAWPEKDVEGAQKLIDGYRARNGGADITLTYVTTAGSPVLNRVAELLQAQLQEADGIKIQIQPLDGAGFATALVSGNYDLILNSLGGAHPDNLYKVFHTKGSGNPSGYSNPTVDQALELTHSSNDPAVVEEAYKTAAREIIATTAYRYWRPSDTSLLVRPGVHGAQQLYQYWLRSDLVWKQQ